MDDLSEKVKKRIDEYLGFESKYIFTTGDPLIFGGAVRDSICGDKINDIDILVGPLTFDNLSKLLNVEGYYCHDKLSNSDIDLLYQGIRLISKPYSFIKNNKVVQLIKPVSPRNINKEELYDKVFNNLIKNVDMSCCGVSYDGDQVIENVNSSILHCQHKFFTVNQEAKMKTNRFYKRESKLINRGWREIDQIEERNLHLDYLTNE